jgi:hypothetical protein
MEWRLYLEICICSLLLLLLSCSLVYPLCTRVAPLCAFDIYNITYQKKEKKYAYVNHFISKVHTIFQFFPFLLIDGCYSLGCRWSHICSLLGSQSFRLYFFKYTLSYLGFIFISSPECRCCSNNSIVCYRNP